MPLEDTVQPFHTPEPIKVDAIRRRIIRKGVFYHACHVEQSHGEYAPLLDLPDDFVEVAHPVVHLPRILVSHHVLRDGANSEYGWI